MSLDQANKKKRRIVKALENKLVTSSALAVDMCSTNLCSALLQPSGIKYPAELRSYNFPEEKKNPSLGTRT